MVIRGLGRGENEELEFTRYRAGVGEDEKVLEMDGDGGDG